MTRLNKLIMVCGSLTVIVAILAASSPFHRPAQAERRKRVRFDPQNFQPQQVVDAFPAIKNPAHVKGDVADQNLQPNELVLGVSIDGASRAYPINMLTGPTREIFNDTLGPHAIAATW